MSSTKPIYVPGTYVRVPSKLLSFRDHYRVVGKNVFLKVSNGKTKPTKPSIDQVLRELSAKKDMSSVTSSLKRIQRELDGALTQWVKCTPEQVEAYHKARTPYDNFVADIKARAKAVKDARIAAENKKAMLMLTKRGYTVYKEEVKEPLKG